MEYVAMLVLFALVIVITRYVRGDWRSDGGPIRSESETIRVSRSSGSMSSGDDELDHEYQSLLSVFADQPNRSEFELYGTKAIVFWADIDKEVIVGCITAFTKGKPVTKRYEFYYFNTKEWYWAGNQPRGCAAEVKKHIESLRP